MHGRLHGRVTLVTGALGGLGLAIARRCAAEGAIVWLSDVAPADAPEVAAALSGFDGAARYVRLDVTDPQSWAAVAEHFAGDGLDVLVNNAGIAKVGPIGQSPFSDWRATMAVNADGPFLGLSALLPALATGGRRSTGWASVVNIASILSQVALPESAAYCASKGALRQLTKAAAIEFAARELPIRVNSVHPGFVRSGMTERGSADMRAGPDLLAALAEQTPMRRLGRAEEIAAAVLFLASDESSFVTGAELAVDGGWTAR